MERLHVLGTGNAMVTNCYNSCFAIENEGKYLLVDAGGGNGILKQLKKAEIDIESIPAIFVSHCHIDHILGVIWLIRLYSAKATKNKGIDGLRIYGHEGVIETLQNMMTMLLNKKQSESLKGKLSLVKVNDGDVIKEMGHELTFFDIKSTKDHQFGCAMDLASGKRFTFLGDEPYREHEYEYAYEADYLMHEAFCLYEDRAVYEPYKKHHATAKDACENAAMLKVANVLLYHTEDDHMADRKRLYTEEGRQYYQGGIYVPNDLEVIEIK